MEKSSVDETEKKQWIKNIINSSKYLKKSIKRLPKESLTEEEKQRLFVHYEELVDAIICHCQ
jgi:hypothetical protein